MTKVLDMWVSILLITFCCLHSINIGHCVPANSHIYVPYSSNIPDIDGQWSTPLEWTDASETRLENESNQTAYLRMKHNTTHLFIVVDFVTDYSRSTYDLGGVCFDTLFNGGDLPQDDDYLFGILAGQTPDQVTMFRGRDAGESPKDAWTMISLPWVVGKASYSSTNDPYEGDDDHRIYELQIPCEYLDQASGYGLYAYVCDYHNNTLLEWPMGSGGTWERWRHELSRVPPAPENWGNISDNFVPEFSPVFILPLFMIVTLLATILYSRKYSM